MNSLPVTTNGQNYQRGMNDDDSGQGSSLDHRDYGIYNNTRYSNGHYSNGLDLTNNREYRGSAFELYKKPLQAANDQYQNSVW